MKWNEGGQYENPPSGSHVARCIKLIDLGTQPVTYNNETKYQRKVMITFELSECLMEGIYKPEVKGKPFAVSRRYTQSLDPKAALRKDLESWRGRKFTKEDIAKFDPKGMLGKPCMINLVEQGEYVNIGGISPVPKSMQVPKQINPSTFFSLEENEFDQDVFGKLPDKTRETIGSSPEFKKLMCGDDPGEPPPQNGDDQPQQTDDCPF